MWRWLFSCVRELRHCVKILNSESVFSMKTRLNLGVRNVNAAHRHSSGIPRTEQWPSQFVKTQNATNPLQKSGSHAGSLPLQLLQHDDQKYILASLDSKRYTLVSFWSLFFCKQIYEATHALIKVLNAVKPQTIMWKRPFCSFRKLRHLHDDFIL